MFSDEEIAQIEKLAPKVMSFDIHSMEDYENFLYEYSKLTGSETSGE
ncbi:MAG: hypothetical protein R2688_07530 [Fimbriimonadaceae bacterium]